MSGSEAPFSHLCSGNIFHSGEKLWLLLPDISHSGENWKAMVATSRNFQQWRKGMVATSRHFPQWRKATSRHVLALCRRICWCCPALFLLATALQQRALACWIPSKESTAWTGRLWANGGKVTGKLNLDNWSRRHFAEDFGFSQKISERQFNQHSESKICSEFL